MLTEQHFPELSRYPKTSGTPKDEIKAFKRRHGYINLDNPHQKARYTSASTTPFNPKLEGERKAGIEQARAEHKAAMQNIKSGKASLRRDDGRKRRGAGRPKVRTEMPTAKGQEVLDTLRTEGVYHVSGWTLSRKYLEGIIHNARELGYDIQAIKTGMRVSHYKLIDKQ